MWLMFDPYWNKRTCMSGESLAAGERLARATVEMQPPNLLYRLLQPMIKREIVKSASVDFANLRGRLESGSTASG